MKNFLHRFKLVSFYLCISLLLILIAKGASQTVTTVSENTPIQNRTCVIIDAGHGGIDTGATSYSGRYESHINLEIALRLEKMIQLLGYKTKMVRTQDISVHTQGTTIAQKKVSDLKNRVEFVNSEPNSIFISIHQNHFFDSKYYGPQVFYSNNNDSILLAKKMQSALVSSLCPYSKRKAKESEGVYLMEKIKTTGLLIECGFLSNPEEEAKLTDPSYQKKLCCVIASTCSSFIKEEGIA